MELELVLFESVIINEFIDAVTPGRLHPEDPLQHARHRGWIEFGSQCLWATREMTTVESEAEFQEVVNSLQTQLAQLEAVLNDGPFFNDAVFSLVDAAYAPLFMRLALLGCYDIAFDVKRLTRAAR